MPAMIDAKTLKQARREVAALKPGEWWVTDHPLSIEEFSDLVNENQKAELLDGVIDIRPSAAAGHEPTLEWLFALLLTFAEFLRLGSVRDRRSFVRLNTHTAIRPDLVFVKRRRRRIGTRHSLSTAPDLAVEFVASKDSRSRAISRVVRYQKSGILEIWYVDITRRLARVYRRRGKNYSVIFEGSDGVIASQVVPGFAIRAEWLWATDGQRPSVASILQDLLAGRIPSE